MNCKFYSRKRLRLHSRDYAEHGYYLVTICTKERESLFGKIVNGKMSLNKHGIIAQERWLDIPKHYDVLLDEYIIMPNHIHGIIIIKNNPVGAGHAQPSNSINLSNIVGSYKSSVTRQINTTNHNHFKWQRSFHDHKIRTTLSLDNIRQYIIDNPVNWANDKNNIISI